MGVDGATLPASMVDPVTATAVVKAGKALADSSSETERFTLLEAGSLDDEDEMADRWAALLANTSRDGGPPTPPSFVEVLRQLTPREAAMQHKGAKPDLIKDQLGIDNDVEFAVMAENLIDSAFARRVPPQLEGHIGIASLASTAFA